MSANLRSWLLSAGFLLVGIGVLWWAHQQRLNMATTSETQTLSIRLLLWILTLIVSGFSFGMAASSARSGRGRARSGIVLTLSLIPFAVLYYFWTQFSLGWFPQLPASLADFLYNESTILAASLVLGFFLSGLLGRAEAAPEPVIEPVERTSDDEGDGEATE